MTDASLSRWEPEIREFETRDRERRPPKGAVLFVGSSSIRLWPALEEDFPGIPLVNRGFGGSGICDVLAYVDRIVMPYAPRRIVFYAGDNDLARRRTPAMVLDDYRQFCERVHAHLPDTPIAFISIKPSPSRQHLTALIRDTNALVKDFSAQDERRVYVDVFTAMLGDDGTPRSDLFVEDGLHMNARGYALWRAAVMPFVCHAPPTARPPAP